jgi:multiple sugar transport system permease protein
MVGWSQSAGSLSKAIVGALARPVIVTVIGALRSFDLVSIMTNGGPFGSSRVLSYYMYEKALGEYGFRMGYGAAIAVVLFAIMMIFISGFIWKMWRDERER